MTCTAHALLDLAARNVLLGLTNMDSWTESQLYERLGQPWIDNVQRWDEQPAQPTAPLYVVEPIDFSEVDRRWLTKDIQLINFGGAYLITSPPSRLGIPRSYLAPEALFELNYGTASDVWALGCVIYVARSGQHLFGAESNMFLFAYIRKLMRLLGPLPERWRKIDFDDEDRPMESQSDDDGDDEWQDDETGTQKQRLSGLVPDIEATYESLEEGNCHQNEDAILDQDSTPSEPCLKPRNVDQRPETRDLKPGDDGYVHYPSHAERKEKHAKAPKISEDESESFCDLLSRILRYEPKERMSIEDILQHEWFVRDFPETKAADGNGEFPDINLRKHSAG